MKKVLVIALLIILVLSLSGCATIRYSVTISTGGERVVDYSVIFDNAEVGLNEYQMTGAYLSYLASVNDNSEYVVSGDFDNELTFRMYYESQTDYYIAMGITGDEVDEPLEPIDNGMLLHYESTLLDIDKADFASYALSYLSYGRPEIGENAVQYLKQHGTDAGVPVDCINDITTVENSTREFVNTLRESSDHRDALANVAYEAMKIEGYDLALLDIYFDFSHVYESVKGINADSVEEISVDLGKQKVYTWKLDSMGKNEIKVSQMSPNVWIWELISIAAGIIVVVVGFTIIFVKSKSGNKKEKKDKNKVESSADSKTTEVDLVDISNDDDININ